MENQFDLKMKSTTGKRVTIATTATLIGTVYFIIVIVTLHFLRPDLNPISEPTSQYAVGPYGFLMTSAFLSMSFASLALVFALYQGVSQPGRSQIGLVLLGIWGVSPLIAMIFPLNPVGTPQNISSIIHRINGTLTFSSLTIGVILVSRCFRHDENWRPFHRKAVTLSLILLAMFVITFLSIFIFKELGFAGLSQRIYLATFVTWLLLTAAYLRSMAVENRFESQKKFGSYG